MPTVATSRETPLAVPRESSIYRVAKDSDDVRQQWKRVGKQREQSINDTFAIEQLTRKVEAMRRRILGGSGAGTGGWDWMYPTHKELDPTLPYSAGKVAYISSLNLLVTAGMTDLISNATATSCPGVWLCVQDVPAAVSGKFNVPVYPYIAGATAKGGATFLMDTTAPTGTPLIGDLDLVDTTTGLPSFYWHYLGKVT